MFMTIEKTAIFKEQLFILKKCQAGERLAVVELLI